MAFYFREYIFAHGTICQKFHQFYVISQSWTIMHSKTINIRYISKLSWKWFSRNICTYFALEPSYQWNDWNWLCHCRKGGDLHQNESFLALPNLEIVGRIDFQFVQSFVKRLNIEHVFHEFRCNGQNVEWLCHWLHYTRWHFPWKLRTLFGLPKAAKYEFFSWNWRKMKKVKQNFVKSMS